MASTSDTLARLLEIDGALCAALVDTESGMTLGSAGSGLDLELAAAGNTEVILAKLKTMRNLHLDDQIEDILISLQHQYHVMRLLPAQPGLFLYFVLDRSKASLAMARRACAELERDLC